MQKKVQSLIEKTNTIVQKTGHGPSVRYPLKFLNCTKKDRIKKKRKAKFIHAFLHLFLTIDIGLKPSL